MIRFQAGMVPIKAKKHNRMFISIRLKYFAEMEKLSP